MTEKSIRQLVRLINEKAKEFGADLVGIASVDGVKRSPSHKMSEKIPSSTVWEPKMRESVNEELMIIYKSKAEEISADDNQETPKKLIKYCRECELICPIGSK